MTFNRIAIMGAGSLGTVLGAYICRGGFDADLIDADVRHVKALNENGARVVGQADFTARVHAITPEQMSGAYDLFIYMAKQTHNGECLPLMKEHSHADTFVCTCQNGIPERAVREYFEAEHVMGAPVGWAARLLEPGVSRLNDPEDNRRFHLGSVNGEITPAMLETKRILESMCKVHISQNLMGIRWSKLNVNATLSGVSVVTGMTFGEICHCPETARVIANVGRETVAVCAATGVRVERYSDILDAREFYSFSDEAGEAEVSKRVATLNPAGYDGIASMLQDIRRGARHVEIDAINGVVCEAGDEAGIETPYNDAIVWITKGLEQRLLAPSKDNLRFFRQLYGKY